MNIEHCAWLSRLSFGTAIVALAASVYTGCQDAVPGKEPRGLLESQPAEAPAAFRPDRMPEMPAKPSAEKSTPAKEHASKPTMEATEPAVTAEPPTSTPVEVKRLVVTSGIEAREPLQPGSFDTGMDAIYAFAELANPSSEERTIVVSFEHTSGKKVGFVELKVPAESKRWRTWGKTAQIKRAGEWTAVVSQKDGGELSRQRFDVLAPAETQSGS